MALKTTHLDNNLGTANHKLFNPAVFYLEEELRKRVELLRWAMVLTGQEMPEGIARSLGKTCLRSLLLGMVVWVLAIPDYRDGD